MQELLKQDHDVSGLEKSFTDLHIVSKTDFDLLKNNLRDMEDECKTSLGYIHHDRNYASDTRNLVSLFLESATQRILSMKIIINKVLDEYQRFLFWLGLPLHLHKVDHCQCLKRKNNLNFKLIFRIIRLKKRLEF